MHILFSPLPRRIRAQRFPAQLSAASAPGVTHQRRLRMDTVTARVEVSPELYFGAESEVDTCRALWTFVDCKGSPDIGHDDAEAQCDLLRNFVQRSKDARCSNSSPYIHHVCVGNDAARGSDNLTVVINEEGGEACKRNYKVFITRSNIEVYIEFSRSANLHCFSLSRIAARLPSESVKRCEALRQSRYCRLGDG